MTATRWTLLILAAGVAAAGWWFATREPAGETPATPAAPAASPLSLLLPAAASEHAASSSATRGAVLPTPSVALSASAPRVGSEGYGPHIERAQAGNDAQAVWEAVNWLRGCASTEARRHSFEQMRNQGVSPEMMTQLMVEVDAEERRCQTVTAQHRALLPELAARAMRAGVPEAASAYASTVFAGDLTPAQRQEVVDAMRRDANAGHAHSLIGALVAHETWGLSETERLSYVLAYATLPDLSDAQHMLKTMMDQGHIRFKPDPPPPEQLAAAKLAARRIVQRAQAAKQP